MKGTKERKLRLSCSILAAAAALLIAASLVECARSPKIEERKRPESSDIRFSNEGGVGPELLPYNPVADAKAIVFSKDGRARFTVLTDRIVRMEWGTYGRDRDGEIKAAHFEDRGSLAFVNRNLDVPRCKSKKNTFFLSCFL